MAWRWQLLLRAKGVDDTIPWLTRAYFVVVRGGADPAHLGRRRRGSHLRDGPTPSRARRHGSGDGPPRTGDRWRRDARPGRGRLPARGRPLRRRRLPLDRGVLRRRDDHPRLPALLAPRAAAAQARPPGARVGSARQARRARLPRDALVPGPRGRPVRGLLRSRSACRRSVCWPSGSAARRSGSTSRRGPYYVMGPLLFLVMLVPFTVNGFAVRESFFVSFLGKLGVSSRPGVRRRIPLLRAHDPDGRSRAR